MSYDTTPLRKSLILLGSVFCLSNDLKRALRSAMKGGNALLKKRRSDRPKWNEQKRQKTNRILHSQVYPSGEE